jgi:cytochrome c oxidase cbb3-type subunit 1
MSSDAERSGGARLTEFTSLHGFFWLFAANLIGVLMAVLLLLPDAGKWLGEWSYGRWVIVHLNWQLYGWTSLPLLAWLLHIYKVERAGFASAAKAAVWMWSLALLIGGVTWLRGGSSGKLFLDWSGYARVYFPLAIIFLWFVVATALAVQLWKREAGSAVAIALKAIGLLVLLPVPYVLYFAADPTVYPPINPSTGGPTGASQLESSLGIVLILLLLPLGLLKRKKSVWFGVNWALLVVHGIYCALLGRADVSHHLPIQYLSFVSLVIWVPLIVFYFRAFEWPANATRWRQATMVWWTLLVVVGLVQYLPGVLDHYKFTDGLVAHSLMAMAGFTTSLLVLLTVLLLGEGEKAEWLNRPWMFWLWHGGTLAYILLMLVSGWIEGSRPEFSFVPGALRNILFALRLLSGVAMTVASADWFFAFVPWLGAGRYQEKTA